MDKGKGKGHPRTSHEGPERGADVQLYSSFNLGARWGVDGQHHAPAALPPWKNRYPLYRRLGGPPGPVWTGAENLAPTGIRSLAVQPVASRYTDCAIPAVKTTDAYLR